MAVLEDVRLEAFAQAIARGLMPPEAALEAGYAHWPNHARKRAERQSVVDRVEELEIQRIVRGSGDVAPLIARLIKHSNDAVKSKEPGSLRDARSLLVEAARLMRLNPSPPPAASPTPWVRPVAELSQEEWMAKYGSPRA